MLGHTVYLLVQNSVPGPQFKFVFFFFIKGVLNIIDTKHGGEKYSRLYPTRIYLYLEFMSWAKESRLLRLILERHLLYICCISRLRC
jgi:hypothetical protein